MHEDFGGDSRRFLISVLKIEKYQSKSMKAFFKLAKKARFAQTLTDNNFEFLREPLSHTLRNSI